MNGENFSAQGWCDLTGNGVFCGGWQYLENAASCDTRSMFQLSQLALEQRFQAWSEDYDTPEGR